MANVVITHFSGIFDNGEFKSSCFYDGLIGGLTESGNNILHVITSDFLLRPWNGSNVPVTEDLKEAILNKIKAFKPDLVISFNNSSIEGIEKTLSCPIVLWDADKFLYFNDKNLIKRQPDRYLFFSFSTSGVIDYLDNLQVKHDRVFRIPSATSVKAIEMEKLYNISFIGNPFFKSNKLTTFLIDNPSYLEVSKVIEQNDCLNLRNKIMSMNISIEEILHQQTGNKRTELIISLLDLGIKIFGPSDWLDLAPYHSEIIKAYEDYLIYSLGDNERIYNSSKISISISHSQNVSGYPWRVPDILASNSVLMSNPLSDLIEDFGKEVDLQLYNSSSEAKDLANKLLNDVTLRKNIVDQQNEVIEKKFRWKHRLQLIEEATGVQLRFIRKIGTYERLNIPNLMIEPFIERIMIKFSRPRKKTQI